MNTAMLGANQRMVHEHVVSRAPFTVDQLERRVSGFYKFNPPGVHLDRAAYEELLRYDPGLPAWDDFQAGLAGSDYLAWVVQG